MTASEQSARLDAKLRRELGQVILRLLDDPRTEDIVLNPDSNLWANRIGEGWVQVGQMTPVQALTVLGTVAAWKGTVINHDNPILETDLPLDGSRFEGLVSPVVRHPVFAIRIRPRKIYTLDDYVADGILTRREDPLNRIRRGENFVETVRGLKHRQLIRRAIEERKNILVAGSTGSGKTTFINGILHDLAEVAPKDRVILIEDTTELQCAVTNFVDLLAVGQIEMVDCVRACMRLKPTRIIAGEVRDGAALEFLKALNTGHPGGAATVHANDALQGLSRLERLIAEAPTAPPQKLIPELIASAIDLVIFIDQEQSLPAGRKVREVAVVTGFRNGRYLLEHV